MKTILILVFIVLLSCASERKGIKVHTKTRIYKEQKQITDKQEMWIIVFTFIMIAAINNATK